MRSEAEIYSTVLEKAYKLEAENAQLKAELAKLQEWQQIILGSGTDKEAVIRMAATKYTEVAVQSWREEVGKLKVELAEARYLRENAESALNTHMEIHARVVNELRAAQAREARLLEALKSIGQIRFLLGNDPKLNPAYEMGAIAQHALEETGT